MTRILFFGDSADTGFGAVTREIGARLLARGHDIRFVNQNVRGWPSTGPLAERTWNRDYFAPGDAHQLLTTGLNGWKPEQAILLADFVAARDLVSIQPDAWSTIPVWHHVPVEGRDLSPLWSRLWNIIRPVAITKFGADEITKVTGKPTPYIYHGVDRSIYHPATKATPIVGLDVARDIPMHIASKDDAKHHFGLEPDQFVLLSCERHMPRKNLNALIRAVAPVLETHDDVRFVIHCKTLDFAGNLDDSKSKLSRKAQSQIGFTRGHDSWRGMSELVLSALYNAADLYLNAGSEGYGLNLINAIGCGTPVLGIDYSAVPEVVGTGGVLVPAHEIDNIYDHYWGTPDIGLYTETLFRLVQNRDEVAHLAAGTQEQAAAHTWEAAADKFDALLASA